MRDKQARRVIQALRTLEAEGIEPFYEEQNRTLIVKGFDRLAALLQQRPREEQLRGGWIRLTVSAGGAEFFTYTNELKSERK